MFKELIPLSPVFAKLFLQYSDLPDKFDLIDEIDYTKQLEEQAQQMAQQLEQLQGLAEGLTKKVQEGEQKIELTKFKGALDSLLTKIRERLNATLKQQQKATSDFEQAQRKQQEG